jgi:predicted  nucleic acid-binding Zn-ribbon protein
MGRHQQLRTSLDGCRERVKYAQRQLDEHSSTLDLSDASSVQTLRKLANDLERAKDDARSLQEQLDDLMD